MQSSSRAELKAVYAVARLRCLIQRVRIGDRIKALRLVAPEQCSVKAVRPGFGDHVEVRRRRGRTPRRNCRSTPTRLRWHRPDDGLGDTCKLEIVIGVRPLTIDRRRLR
jgi:hypothetical protein